MHHSSLTCGKTFIDPPITRSITLFGLAPTEEVSKLPEACSDGSSEPTAPSLWWQSGRSSKRTRFLHLLGCPGFQSCAELESVAQLIGACDVTPDHRPMRTTTRKHSRLHSKEGAQSTFRYTNLSEDHKDHVSDEDNNVEDVSMELDNGLNCGA